MDKVKLLCGPKTMEMGQIRGGFEFWLSHFLALYLGQVPSTLCESVACEKSLLKPPGLSDQSERIIKDEVGKAGCCAGKYLILCVGNGYRGADL